MKPRGFSTRLALFLAAMTALTAVAAAVVTAGDSNANTRRWYVSAAAGAGGNGSAVAPFNSLALVQQASGPGDTIIVLPSPISVPPLDGGIVLKAGQRLVGGGPLVVRFGASLISGGPPVVGPSGSLFRCPGSTTQWAPLTQEMLSHWRTVQT